MKSILALLAQGFIVLFGIAVLAFLLWEPHVEGRNVDATTFEVYFNDPFLAYVYLGSTPFFYALHQAFGLFGDLRRNGKFSPGTVEALRTIKRCAIALIGFVAGAIVFILLFGDKEDRPAGFAMGLFVALNASIVAAVAGKFVRNLEKAMVQDQ